MSVPPAEIRKPEAGLRTVIGTSGFDVGTHGTSVVGIALRGPLDDLPIGNGSIQLHRRLESVCILPGGNEPETDQKNYGTIAIQAMVLPESVVQRPRVFCFPISTKPDRPGQPTLWSASVDALAAGVDVVCDGEQWNALTVGAHTELTTASTDPQYHCWKAVAEKGQLSPRRPRAGQRSR